MSRFPKSRFALVLIALGASAFGASAFADDCSPIRLDDEGGSMEHVTIRNQRSIGSCYAHASAQMYDSWRFRHGEDQSDDYENFSSGFEVGQYFKIDQNDSVQKDSPLHHAIETDINGGFIKRLLPFLLEEGTCSQRELNGLFEDESGLDVDLYASAIMSKLKYYRNAFHEAEAAIHAKYFPAPEAPAFGSREDLRDRMPVDHTYAVNHAANRIRLQNEMENATAANREIEAARKRFLALGIADLKAYHQSVLKNKDTPIDYDALAREAMHWTPQEVNTVTMFKIIAVIGCSHRQLARGRFKVDSTRSYSTVFHLIPKLRNRYQPSIMKSVLNAELDKGLARAYPIGINYCSTILGAGLGFTPKKWDDNDACHRHASLVIGRRPDPKRAGRCQYLIRNSWGDSVRSPNYCRSYHPDWDCDGPKGSVWIDADTLGLAVHDLQTMRTIHD